MHTIDRAKIAQRLSEQRPANLPPLQVLIQVNTSGEASKSGISENEVFELAELISGFTKPHVKRIDVDSENVSDHESQLLHLSWTDLK